jgi:hypothetical protein
VYTCLHRGLKETTKLQTSPLTFQAGHWNKEGNAIKPFVFTTATIRARATNNTTGVETTWLVARRDYRLRSRKILRSGTYAWRKKMHMHELHTSVEQL